MRELMMGNAAIARGAYEAGVTMAIGYPGTPSTEIIKEISNYECIYNEWSVNEKVALEVAIGGSLAGSRTICTMKHVGLNVAADPLFNLSYTGVNAGVVIIVADDPGMHSSQNEQDSRFYAIASKIPILEPVDSQECKDFIIKAFEISEEFDTPVIVRITTRIAHSESLVEIKEKIHFTKKEYIKNHTKNLLIPAIAREKRKLIEKRINELEKYTNRTELNTIEWGSKTIGVITSGISYQYTREALGNISILKIGMCYPFPKEIVREFSGQVEKLYVIEELSSIMENEVLAMGIGVEGKGLFPKVGELSSSIIKEVILGEKQEIEEELEKYTVNRPAMLCVGCSHRGVFHILNKMKVSVLGDIGCYTLGGGEPFKSIDACVCMGASIGMQHGMEKATSESSLRNSVAIIGDSTFFHSGITSLINMVYNKGIGTVIIMDNSITAMTGHQPNPATNAKINKGKTIEIDIENLVKSIGIIRVKTIDPMNNEEFENEVKYQIKLEEPSVIIAKRPCLMINKNREIKKKRIDLLKCNKCNKCLKLGCPAIKKVNNSIQITEEICEGCGLCKSICSFKAIVD